MALTFEAVAAHNAAFRGKLFPSGDRPAQLATGQMRDMLARSAQCFHSLKGAVLSFNAVGQRSAERQGDVLLKVLDLTAKHLKVQQTPLGERERFFLGVYGNTFVDYRAMEPWAPELYPFVTLVLGGFPDKIRYANLLAQRSHNKRPQPSHFAQAEFAPPKIAITPKNLALAIDIPGHIESPDVLNDLKKEGYLPGAFLERVTYDQATDRLSGFEPTGVFTRRHNTKLREYFLARFKHELGIQLQQANYQAQEEEKRILEIRMTTDEFADFFGGVSVSMILDQHIIGRYGALARQMDEFIVQCMNLAGQRTVSFVKLEIPLPLSDEVSSLPLEIRDPRHFVADPAVMNDIFGIYTGLRADLRDTLECLRPLSDDPVWAPAISGLRHDLSGAFLLTAGAPAAFAQYTGSWPVPQRAGLYADLLACPRTLMGGSEINWSYPALDIRLLPQLSALAERLIASPDEEFGALKARFEPVHLFMNSCVKPIEEVRALLKASDWEGLKAFFEKEITDLSGSDMNLHQQRALAVVLALNAVRAMPEMKNRIGNLFDLALISDSLAARVRGETAFAGELKRMALDVIHDLSLTFDDYYGFDDLKQNVGALVEEYLEILSIVERTGNRKALAGNILGYNGLGLVGLPGVGKTYLAECIAGQLRLPRIIVNFTEIAREKLQKNQPITTDELMTVFRDNLAAAQTRSLKGPVLFFVDELELIASARFNPDNTRSDSPAAQVLTIVEQARIKFPNIIFIWASNHPYQMDLAMIRPGRSDAVIELKEPDLEQRAQIVKRALEAEGTEVLALAQGDALHQLAAKADGLLPISIIKALHTVCFKKIGKGEKLSLEDLTKALEKAVELSKYYRDRCRAEAASSVLEPVNREK